MWYVKVHLSDLLLTTLSEICVCCQHFISQLSLSTWCRLGEVLVY